MRIKIIAVDFDGTLTREGGWPGIAPPALIHKLVLLYLKYKQRRGATIILNTLREGIYLDDARHWLFLKGFRPDYINENAEEEIKQWNHDPRKIAADRYIDDRNMGVLGWLLRKA